MIQTPPRLLVAALAGCLAISACHKKQAAAPAPPPPKPAATPTPVAKPQPSPPARAAAVKPPASTAPAPNYPNAATRVRIDQLLSKIEDAYFDYDKASLRSDATKTLTADSTELRDILRDYPDYKLTIEGYCDERGSAEYNVALGQRRAEAAKDYLAGVGIPGSQLNAVSYGKERQVCSDPNESCYQKNRRIHITPADQAQNRSGK